MKIAILGKPNAGKSSLFNRIIRSNDAITSDISGTTRDVKTKEASIDNKVFKIVDTGGIDESTAMFRAVKQKAIEAAGIADIIIYLVDGKTLADEEDKKIFYSLQNLNKPIALAVNKIDNEKEEALNGVNFYEFGAENIFFISVSHNRNVKTLYNWLYNELPSSCIGEEEIKEDNDFSCEDMIEQPKEEEIEDKSINISIIGRPNVGKSSILNSLAGKNVSVVSEVAGTTIDPVDESFEYKGVTLNFIDTAGLRRRGKIKDLEKYALLRTKERLKEANLALLILDVEDGFKELDEKIASLIDENYLGVIVVLNKWDEKFDSYEKIVEEYKRRFVFLTYAPYVAVSSKTGRNIDKLKDTIIEVYQSYALRISTSKLNATIEEATRRHSLPAYRGKKLKIYYATQYDSKPIKISLVMNKPEGLHFSYKRYLTNFLREKYNIVGAPVLFFPRAKGDTRIKNDVYEE